MRKAMICVSVMLALLQLWPFLFGHSPAPQIETAAVAAPAPRPVLTVALPESCHRHYQTEYRRCAPGDLACGTRVTDRWDLCEATGFWPQ